MQLIENLEGDEVLNRNTKSALNNSTNCRTHFYSTNTFNHLRLLFSLWQLSTTEIDKRDTLTSYKSRMRPKITAKTTHSWRERHALHLMGSSRFSALWTPATAPIHQCRVLREKDPRYTNDVTKLFISTKPDVPDAAKLMREILSELWWNVLPRSPYLPDVAPLNCDLFPLMQHYFPEQQFGSLKKVNNDKCCFKTLF